MKGVVAKLQTSPVELAHAIKWPELPVMNHQHEGSTMRERPKKKKSLRQLSADKSILRTVPLAKGSPATIFLCRKALDAKQMCGNDTRTHCQRP